MKFKKCFQLLMVFCFSVGAVETVFASEVSQSKTLGQVLEKSKLKKVRSRGAVKKIDGKTVYDEGPVALGAIGQIDIGFGYVNANYSVGACSVTSAAPVTVISDFCSGGHFVNRGCDILVEVSFDVIGENSLNLVCPRTFYDDNGVPVGNDVVNDQFTWNVIDVKPEPKKCDCAKGSYISIDNQVLIESISLIGTDFTLNYSTRHAYGYISREGSPRDYYFRANGWAPSIHHYYSKTKKILYTGMGESTPLNFKVQDATKNQVVSSNGDEVYVFDNSTGMHLQTLFGLTGAVKYTFEYETDNQLKSITDSYGNITQFLKDVDGNLTTIQAPRGQLTQIVLDPVTFLITKVTNPKSEVYTLTYFPDSEHLSSFKKPAGQISTFNYDDYGRITLDKGQGGNFWSFLTDITLNPQPLVKVSALNRETAYTVAVVDGVHSRIKTEPSLLQTTTTEQANGAQKVSNSILTTIETKATDERLGDNYQRLASEALEIAGVTNTVTYSQTLSPATPTDYFTFNSILKQKVASGNRTTTELYTAATKTFLTTSPAGVTTTKVIDNFENPVSFQLGNDTPISYTYDTFGRVSKIDQAGFNTLTYTYNALGNLRQIQNARNEKIIFSYDLAGRLKSKTFPDTTVVSYIYNSAGDLARITPPSRPFHSFVYNQMELVSHYRPPVLTDTAPTETIYAYNLDKQLRVIKRPDGQQVNYVYDATKGLLNQIKWGTQKISYTYFPNSDQIQRIQSPDAIINHYTYRGPDLKKVVQVDAGQVINAYDGSHRISSKQVKGITGSLTTTNTYNADDRPLKVGSLQLSYVYPSGRLQNTILTNISDSRTYDALGNLQSYTATYTPSATVLYSYSLVRDSMSRIMQKTEFIDGITTVYDYVYDLAGKLTSVKKDNVVISTYNYDTNGNRLNGIQTGTAFVATYDAQDRLLTYNDDIYSYNNNGEVTGIQNTTIGNKTFSYDPFGHLKTVSLPGGTAIAYKLDGNFNRVVKSVNGVVNSKHLDSGSGQRVADLTSAGDLQNTYVFATDAYSPDYLVKAGVTYRIIKDHLGSPRLIARADTGVVAQRIDYSEFGEVLADTSPGFQAFGFAGGIYDGDTKLVRFGARDYDASTGRWLSKDPIGFDGGDTNLYGYVLNDPVNLLDPEGEAPRAAMAPDAGIGGGNSGIFGGAIPIAAMCQTGVSSGDPAGGHTKNKRPSTKNKHEEGDARRKRDQGGEKKKQTPDWKPRK